MKIIIITIVSVIILGGGGYYVVFVQPEQYGKGFVEAFKRVEERQSVLQGSSQSQQTPAEVLSNVQKQKEFFEFARKEVSDLTPPLYGEYRQFHKDFLFMMDTMSAVSIRLGELMAFGAKVQGLKLALEFEGLQKIDLAKATVGQIVPILEEHIAKAKSLAQELFAKEEAPLPTKKPSWGEIKTAWSEVEQGLDTVLAWYRSLDPKILAVRVGPETMGAREREALLKMEQFKKLLEEFLIAQPADSLSSSLSPTAQMFGISEEEFKALNDRVSKTIENIRQKYGEK